MNIADFAPDAGRFAILRLEYRDGEVRHIFPQGDEGNAAEALRRAASLGGNHIVIDHTGSRVAGATSVH
ncbi:MAG: hypothetical protein KGI41_02555 [Patescibacteria group bacterium]|nr:hypothetical protein [Patescibacteria group bacterium]MDE1966096.1 hypothetical protein [Patescibacteria group bacterium]